MNFRAEDRSTLYQPDPRPAEDQPLSLDTSLESPHPVRSARNSSLSSAAENDKAPASVRSVRSASHAHTHTHTMTMSSPEKRLAPSPFPSTATLRASKPRFGDYEAIKHHLNFYMALRDKELDTEFHLFNTNKKSGGFIIVSSVLFLCVLVPLQVAVIVNDARSHENVSTDELRWRFFFSCASLLFIVFAALSAITLSLRHRGFDAAEKLRLWLSPRNSFSNKYYNNNNNNNNNARPRSLYMTLRPAGSWMFGFDLSTAKNGVNRSDSELDETPPVLHEQWDASHRFYYRVNILFALCVQYYFLFMLLRKVFQIDCINNGHNEFYKNGNTNEDSQDYTENKYDWYVLMNCYEDSALIQVTQSFCIMLITMPAIIKVNLPDTPIGLTWCNLLGSFSVFVVVALYRHLHACIPIALFWMFVCFFTIIDAQTRNMLVFFANKHLTETMRENERMAEENRVEEMRHMLANVAHDLKTPLSSFSTGVDLIYQSMHEYRARLVSHSLSVSPFAVEQELATVSRGLADAVLTCVSNMRSTNAFMVMTINRCIEYTKVTKGGRLQPKHETVNLADALQLPLSCMRNIQEKMTIGIASIPLDLSLFIVTDKQWLQENVLCLLSNAVKYSHEGQVVVRLKLEKKEIIKRRGHSSNNNRNSKSNAFNDAFSGSSLASSARSIRSPDTQTHTNTHSHKIVVERTDTLQENTVMEEVDDLMLLVEVEDTGIGVPAHMKQSLFRPFNQTQKMAGGTGLGLFSLAKRVEALQGDYGVRDRTDNVAGSVFWFAIPYQPDEMYAELCMSREDSTASQNSQTQSFEQLFEQYGVSVVAAQRQAANNARNSLFPAALSSTISRANLLLNLNNNSNNNVKSFVRSRSDSSSSSTTSAPRVVRPATISTTPQQTTHAGIAVSSPTNKDVLPSTVRPLNILLVDDTLSIVKMSSMMLCKLGHRVTVAENGAAAVKRVCEQFENTREPFDVVLMDLQMPVMDGLEATRRIRDYEEQLIAEGKVSFHQRIVGMSANTDEETRQLSISAGMDAFAGKPMTSLTLNKIMQNLD